MTQIDVMCPNCRALHKTNHEALEISPRIWCVCGAVLHVDLPELEKTILKTEQKFQNLSKRLSHEQ